MKHYYFPCFMDASWFMEGIDIKGGNHRPHLQHDLEGLSCLSLLTLTVSPDLDLHILTDLNGFEDSLTAPAPSSQTLSPPPWTWRTPWPWRTQSAILLDLDSSSLNLKDSKRHPPWPWRTPVLDAPSPGSMTSPKPNVEFAHVLSFVTFELTLELSAALNIWAKSVALALQGVSVLIGQFFFTESLVLEFSYFYLNELTFMGGMTYLMSLLLFELTYFYGPFPAEIGHGSRVWHKVWALTYLAFRKNWSLVCLIL